MPKLVFPSQVLMFLPCKAAEQVAQHVALEYGVEQVDDLAQLSEEDVAAAVAVLSLQKVFANKLKEAVKAAQVFSSFGVHVVYPVYNLLMPTRVSGQAHAASAARQQTCNKH